VGSNRISGLGAAGARVWGAVLSVAIAFTITACGGSGPKVDPTTLLTMAKAKLDASSSVHFTLSSQNTSTSGTTITGGEGDLARPDEMQGTFTVTLHGFSADIKVVSKGGVFEALLPFTTHYVVTNPANYGLTNPAELLNRSNGLTSLLGLAHNPQSTKPVRLNGELLDTVTYQVPGSAVPVLPDAKPSVPVTLVVAINPKNFELRQVSLTGPFTSATSNSTYVVTLTNYDENVTITLSPTS
jgi:lipoprotein LprG